MYTRAPALDQSLEHYLTGHFVTHAQFNEESKSYTFREPGHSSSVSAPGLLPSLKREYYPTYRDGTKRRRLTLSKGSSAKQGKDVHRQIAQSITGKAATHRLALAVLEHLAKMGHTVQACEVPCAVSQLHCITQADLISRDRTGALHLWEVKTGYPVGGFRTQGMLKGKLRQVPNTKMAHWQLQLRYTQLGLEAAGVRFKTASIIQVFDKYNKKTKTTSVYTKIHKQTDWALKLV